MLKQNQKKKKRLWVLAGIFFCLVFVLLMITGFYVVEKIWGRLEMIEYSNSIYGFSFSYPARWLHKEKMDGIFISPDADSLREFKKSEITALVKVYGWHNSIDQTMDDFLEQKYAENKYTFEDYKIVKQSNVELGGLEAKRLDETYTGADLEINMELQKPEDKSRKKIGNIRTEEKMRRISIYHLDSGGGLEMIIACPEDNWKGKEALIKEIIDSYSLDNDIYENEVGSIKENDADQIRTVAQKFVKADLLPEGNFSILINKQIDEWALLTVTPHDSTKTDLVYLLLKKENGQWRVVGFGADLSQWHDQTPSGLWY